MTVSKDSSWGVLWGALYMIISISVSITAFGAAASDAFSPFSQFYGRFVQAPVSEDQEGEFLHRRIRRVAIFKISEIVFHFVAFNAFGVLVSRFFIRNVNELGNPWSWVEATYWAIQTTTTVGTWNKPAPFFCKAIPSFGLTFDNILEL